MTTEKELKKLEEMLKQSEKEREMAREKLAIKLKLIKNRMAVAPERFAANHPILTFITTAGGHLAKTGIRAGAIEGNKIAKEVGKGAKETGKVLWQGAKAFGKYAMEKKAAQLFREGHPEEAERLMARAKRIRV